jgi:hypothetical protein
VIDLIVPLALGLGLTVALNRAAGLGPTLSWLAGAVLAALYGYFRSNDSNRKRKAGAV